MNAEQKKVRVLYSFPHKLGAGRICYTAWQQVTGLAAAGADLLVFPGVLHKPVPTNVKVRPTLAWGKARISYKLLGTMHACAMHDYIVARRLEKLVGQIDIIHTWPLGGLRTLRIAKQMGIPAVLERPNTHTRFGYTVVKKECDRLGVRLPKNDNHSYNDKILKKEEKEYELAYRLLCPSDFVVKTFLDQGVRAEKLVRHMYGYDESKFYPGKLPKNCQQELTMIFVGVCGIVKGLHYALEAWLKSPAHNNGTFLIVGEFVPGYKERLSPLLNHPSIHILGPRQDVPELMRKSHILVLPSLTEGFALVCAEAMASGCVPLVSAASEGICRHEQNALVHAIGDVNTLANHITMVHEDRGLLERMRNEALRTAQKITWNTAGVRLLQIYREIISANTKVHL